MSEQTTLREADPLAEVMQRERQLLDPRVRCQPHLVRALLHPDFLEHGASGRMWSCSPSEPTVSNVPVCAVPSGFTRKGKAGA